VPSTAEAFVDLKTLLGAKFVDLRSPAYRGPFLADGAQVREGTVGPELEDVLASGTQVLDAIRPADAATVVSTLAQAAQGHGQDVARGIDANAQLSTLFAQTLTPQEQSLHDFQVLFGHLANSGPVLNALADAVNQGVPVYASAKAQAELDRVLRDLVPFSNNLGDLLIVQRPQWDRLITAGDVVLGTIAGRPGGLQNLVQGLARYVFKLSGPPAAMRDGSAAAGFVNFIGGDSMKLTVTQICIALPTPIRVHIPLCTGTA